MELCGLDGVNEASFSSHSQQGNFLGGLGGDKVYFPPPTLLPHDRDDYPDGIEPDKAGASTCVMFTVSPPSALCASTTQTLQITNHELLLLIL